MRRRLNITVLVDTSAIPDNDPDFTAEEHEPTTEYHVTTTLRELGHNVSVRGAVHDIGTLVGTLTEPRPDIVFNLTETLH